MASEYDQMLLTYLSGGMVSLALTLGRRLGLLEAFCALGSPEKHTTAEAVAEKANCKPRYVREWMACLACAGIFQSLLNSSWIANMAFVPLFADVREQLEEAFRADNPRLGMDYANYQQFYSLMAACSQTRHREYLIPKVVPDLGHGIAAKLAAGGMKCLDIGCGNGFHVQLFANEYPKSEFYGLDLVPEAIEAANQQKAADGTKNSTFIACDAAHLPHDWGNTFDFVTIFDACHDQTRPDLSLREIHRVLKPGGIFAMVEVKATGSVLEDKKTDPLRSSMHYGCSLFHCLPVGSNKEGALCLGTMWGNHKQAALLKECGFANPERINPAYYPVNTIYVCKK
ncbi:unnamed protein product, partial [Mesorhabditis spiculigera]